MRLRDGAVSSCPMPSPIAVIFDFDDTLAPDSTSGFLDSIGIEPTAFWNERVQPRLAAGWDPIPAYLYQMVVESRKRPRSERITRQRLEQWGGDIEFFTGVKSLFGSLREEAKSIDPHASVEFYLISSGIEAILRATSIASNFRDIWGCAFHYNDDEEIEYARNVVSFTEKTRFLFQISKGLVGPEARESIGDVNRRVRDGQYRIPMSRMIFVGDGQTDVPCFTLVKRYGGVPIGVYDPDRPSKWGSAWDFVREQRVASLYRANYRKGGDLHNALRMAVRSLAEEIAQTSY